MVLAAIGQICSTSSLHHNLSQCLKLVQKASSAGATALFLPEASDYIGANSAQTISLCQPRSTSPFVLGLQEAARKHNIAINVGIHEPADSESEKPSSPSQSQSQSHSPKDHTTPKKIKNSLIHILPTGAISQTYTKLHLFNVSLPSPGPTLRESDSVLPGHTLTSPFPSPIGNLGMLICFDLRFPEPSLSLRRQGAEILLCPSAFTVPTGRAHWETLLRARAIETQSYVIAAAQAGVHHRDEATGKPLRRSYGCGMVVDPWGRVVAKLGGEEEDDEQRKAEESEEERNKRLSIGEIAVVDINLDLVNKVRREMPLERRTDVYPEI